MSNINLTYYTVPVTLTSTCCLCDIFQCFSVVTKKFEQLQPYPLVSVIYLKLSEFAVRYHCVSFTFLAYSTS
jgi:hypothetical protein